MRRRTSPLDTSDLAKIKPTDTFDIVLFGDGNLSQRGSDNTTSLLKACALGSRWTSSPSPPMHNGTSLVNLQFQWSSLSQEYLVKWPKFPLSQLMVSHEIKATAALASELRKHEDRDRYTLLPSATQSEMIERSGKEFLPIPQMLRFGATSSPPTVSTGSIEAEGEVVGLLNELFPQDTTEPVQNTGGRRLKLGSLKGTSASASPKGHVYLHRREAERALDSSFSLSFEMIQQLGRRKHISEQLHSNSSKSPDGVSGMADGVDISQFVSAPSTLSISASDVHQWERWLVLLERIAYLILQDIVIGLHIPPPTLMRSVSKPVRRPKSGELTSEPPASLPTIESFDPFTTNSLPGLNSFPHRCPLPDAIPISLVNTAMQSIATIMAGSIEANERELLLACPPYLYHQWLLWRMSGADIWRPWGLPLSASNFNVVDIDAYFMPAAGSDSNVEDDTLLRSLRAQSSLIDREDKTPMQPSSATPPLIVGMSPHFVLPLSNRVVEDGDNLSKKRRLLSGSVDFAIRSHWVPLVASILADIQKDAGSLEEATDNTNSKRVTKRFADQRQRDGLGRYASIEDFAKSVQGVRLPLYTDSVAKESNTTLMPSDFNPLMVRAIADGMKEDTIACPIFQHTNKRDRSKHEGHLESTASKVLRYESGSNAPFAIYGNSGDCLVDPRPSSFHSSRKSVEVGPMELLQSEPAPAKDSNVLNVLEYWDRRRTPTEGNETHLWKRVETPGYFLDSPPLDD